MNELYMMAMNDIYDNFPPDDAYWIFTEFKILMGNPDFEGNVARCMEVAIKKHEQKNLYKESVVVSVVSMDGYSKNRGCA